MRTFALGDNLDSETVNNAVRGAQTDGVITGCATTEQAVPDMTVAVSAGVVLCGSKCASVTAGNVTITAADATDRYDLVVASDAGVLSAVKGTASATFPQVPHSSSTQVAIAIISVPGNATTIQTSQIIDARVNVRCDYGDLIYCDEAWTNYQAAGNAKYTVKTITIPAGVLRRSDEIAGEFWLLQDVATNAALELDFAAATLVTARDTDKYQRIQFRLMSTATADGTYGYKSMSWMMTTESAGSVYPQTEHDESSTEIQMQNTFDILINLTMTTGKKCSVTNIKIWRTGTRV